MTAAGLSPDDLAAIQARCNELPDLIEDAAWSIIAGAVDAPPDLARLVAQKASDTALAATDVPALLALVRGQQARLDKVEAELAHAEMNGHVLDGDSQGVSPGERVPAVRIAFIRAALEATR